MDEVFFSFKWGLSGEPVLTRASSFFIVAIVAFCLHTSKHLISHVVYVQLHVISLLWWMKFLMFSLYRLEVDRILIRFLFPLVPLGEPLREEEGWKINLSWYARVNKGRQKSWPDFQKSQKPLAVSLGSRGEAGVTDAAPLTKLQSSAPEHAGKEAVESCGRLLAVLRISSPWLLKNMRFVTEQGSEQPQLYI